MMSLIVITGQLTMRFLKNWPFAQTVDVPGEPKTRLPVPPNVKFVLLLVIGLLMVRVLLSADMRTPTAGSGALRLTVLLPKALSLPTATVPLAMTVFSV